MTSVEPKNLEKALSHVRAGGKLFVPSYTRYVVISAACLAKWERAGLWLLREEGNGYRLRQGKGSVYLFPGQLRYM